MAKIKLQDEEKKKNEAAQKDDKTILYFSPTVTYLWLLALLVVFPIFTNQAYMDILTAKYRFLLVVDTALIVIMAIWFIASGRLTRYVDSMKSHADPATGKWFRNWCKASFDALDVCMLAFLLFCILSTLVSSPYMIQAITGNEGRWHGLILLSLYVVTYFIISRGMEFKPKIITFFLIASMYVCFVAITDYFKMDILHYKQGISPDNYKIFTSTIGNINTFTSFGAIPLAVAGILFMMNTEKLWKTILFYVAFAFALVSIVIASSDNGYLSFFSFFAFAPLVTFLTYKGIRRYVILLASFLSALLLIQYMSDKLGDAVVAPEGMVTVLGHMTIVKVLAIVLWILAAVLCIYDLAIKKRHNEMPAGKVLRNIWAVLLGMGFIGVIIILIIANDPSNGLPSFLEPFRRYLILDDSWGTNRMFVWKALMKIRKDIPFINKLLGTGPETSVFYFNRMYDEIAAFTHQVYDSPHNELLQTFFCMGPFGLISYVGIYVSVIVLAAKNRTKKYYPYMMAIAFMCITHLAECWVNIMVPIDVAVVFALIAVAGGLFKNRLPKEELLNAPK